MSNSEDLRDQPAIYNPALCRERHADLRLQYENYKRSLRDNEEAHRQILQIVSLMDQKVARIAVWAMVGPGLVGIVVGAILTAIAKGLF
jgi:hypothetical protein